jgi:tRNA-uridine 2-sulfurtransferase
VFHAIVDPMDTEYLRSLAGKKIAVGMSGGVDSSTVLALLAEAGADVMGITMKIWRPGVMKLAMADNTCYGPGKEGSIAASEAICASLGVPYRAIDLASEYEEHVIEYFKREYRSGRTPNPCVVCNRDVKFGFLLEKAKAEGFDFDYFATGHYARIETRNGLPTLRRSVVEAKDQSYFMFRLGPTTLAKVLFPLGGTDKASVRNEAKRLGLSVAAKTESQDFIAGGYGSLFEKETPGDIVDESGAVVGRHRGIVFYTIGQRRGLNISTGPEALYVKALDAAGNRVIVAHDEALFHAVVEGDDAILHDSSLEGTTFGAFVRIRQNHKPARASVRVTGGSVVMEFVEAQRAAAPGQSAVFYDADGFVLGGCAIR